jgi:DNA mismatch repair protein MutS
VPPAVIRRAREYLAALEQQPVSAGVVAKQPALDLQPPAVADPLRERLAALDPDGMSPRDALDALYELKRLR